MRQCVCRKTGQCVHCVKEKNPCFMNVLQYQRNQKKRLKMKLRNYGKMSLDLFYRDPYMLDFLGLHDTYSEKDLENAILAELEKFILEMGSDFAFLARQKHFVLDGKDYYMDLLFYHRGLRRLVLVELKLGEFEPQDKGQVELYLRWLEKNERVEGEESPIALILCAEKSQETIELMQLDHGNIHVGQYMTKMPPKELLEQKLYLAIANARELLEQRKEEKLREKRES